MVGPKTFLGTEIVFGARNCFWGSRKSYLATEHHNEAAPKKKKEPRFFRLATEKYDFRAPKEQRPRSLNGSRCRSRNHTPVQFTRISCGSEANGDGCSLPELGRSDIRRRS